MALYRTYRPATFADVVGQEHVTEPLCRALDSGRINHAYLFSGPRGCGKTSSARILARSLNCVEGPTSTPCGVCDSCVALAPGGPGNLDVMELDAASHGNVDDTRDLRDRASYSPAASRYRVFIIDEAHMVSSAGFNALLKVVEEPPEHLIFVFATTEPEKVLPTIRSRTHHYPFRLLAPPTMRGLLESICGKEDVTVDPAVFPLVVRAGGGSPRDSLSILDQLLAGADENGVGYERAVALLGVTDVALIDQSVDALADGDGSALFEAVERLVDAGHDPRRFGVDLLERFRDLILMQAVPDASERGLVEAPGDQIDRMRTQLGRIGLATLTRYAETVHAALGEMRGTTSPRLLLEVMCARMLLPAATDTESAMLQRIERIEAQLADGGPRVASRPNATAPVAATGDPVVPQAAPPKPEADSGARFVRKSRQPAADAAPDRPSNEEASDDATARAATRIPVVPAAADVRPNEPAAPEPPAPEPAARESAAREPAAGSSPARDSAAQEPTATVVTVDAIRTAWGDICAVVGRLDKIIAVMVSAAVVREVDGHHLTISHDTAPLVARLGSERGRTVIATAMHETFGGEWSVACVHAADDVTTGSAPVATRSANTYSRRRDAEATTSGDRGRRESRSTAATSDDEPPPPEEPAPEPEPPVADEDLSDAERDEMIANAHSSLPDPRHDPEQVAMQLLATELGARRID